MRNSIETILGSQLKTVTFDEQTHVWRFGFGFGNALSIETPWRITNNERILLGSVDHMQQFGLPQPVNAATEAKLLLNGEVTSADVNSCADVNIVFSNGNQLEVYNSSSGYEGWSLFIADKLVLVAQGGGTLLPSVVQS